MDMVDNLLQQSQSHYIDICTQSNVQDFDSTWERYASSEQGTGDLNLFTTVGGIASAYADSFESEDGIIKVTANKFATWLRNGNCPPPPRTAGSFMTYDEHVILAGGEKDYNLRHFGAHPPPYPNRDDEFEDLAIESVLKENGSGSLEQFLKENWKGFAIAGGLILTAWALWGVSAFLVADDITGVGTFDDPALAVTVPAATAATTATVATVTALAASALLYFGVSTTDPSHLS